MDNRLLLVLLLVPLISAVSQKPLLLNQKPQAVPSQRERVDFSS